MKIATIAVAVFFSGCAAMSLTPAKYWTEHQRPAFSNVIVNDIEDSRIFALYCYRYPQAIACSVSDPDLKACRIFVKKNHALLVRNPDFRAEVIAHELCHCEGYSHPEFMNHGDTVACPKGAL